MGFMLFIFTASLFQIFKYFKIEHLVIKSVSNQILFHLLEGILFLYAFYLMNDGKGYVLSWILMYFLLFLPISVYQVRYGDDEKFKKIHNKNEETQ